MEMYIINYCHIVLYLTVHIDRFPLQCEKEHFQREKKFPPWPDNITLVDRFGTNKVGVGKLSPPKNVTIIYYVYFGLFEMCLYKSRPGIFCLIQHINLKIVVKVFDEKVA